MQRVQHCELQPEQRELHACHSRLPRSQPACVEALLNLRCGCCRIRDERIDLGRRGCEGVALRARPGRSDLCGCGRSRDRSSADGEGRHSQCETDCPSCRSQVCSSRFMAAPLSSARLATEHSPEPVTRDEVPLAGTCNSPQDSASTASSSSASAPRWRVRNTAALPCGTRRQSRPPIAIPSQNRRGVV